MVGNHKKYNRIPVSQLIGIGLLGLLIIGFFASVLIQRLPASVDDARFIFAGTVEDADCSILINTQGCIVVDTGEAVDGEHICALLKEQGVERIDYLILTHPDKDHIGGATAVLDSFQVGEVITPHYGQYSSEYNAVLKRLETCGTVQTVLTEQKSFKLGSFRISIYPPRESFYDDDNEYSLVTLVNHGDVSLLLAADIEKIRLEELENVDFGDVTLLKVPYHGRSGNASADFIRKTNPEFAIVNAKNPEAKIQKVLNKLGAEVFCTVGRDWAFDSDGRELTLSSDYIGIKG